MQLPGTGSETAAASAEYVTPFPCASFKAGGQKSSFQLFIHKMYVGTGRNRKKFLIGQLQSNRL
jgi:hypothetical protein